MSRMVSRQESEGDGRLEAATIWSPPGHFPATCRELDNFKLKRQSAGENSTVLTHWLWGSGGEAVEAGVCTSSWVVRRLLEQEMPQ